MRIGHVTFSYHPITGGGDTYLAELLKVLEADGHDQRVYQRPVPGPPPDGVRYIPDPLGCRLRRGQFWTVPLGLRRLRGELASEDILIAHYPNYHWAIEWHPRTVLISHGVFWDDRPGALRSQIKRRLALRAYRSAGQVVANDTFYLREMGEDVPIGADPFVEVAPGRWFIPNCVDTERFRPVMPMEGLSRLAPVLVPRNLFRNRGVHLAIQAFALLAPDFPETNLVVVGADSQPEYRAECDVLVRRLGLEARVVFYGPVSWRRMPQIYSSARVTVIPSLSGEGTSLAALESMACGTPAVTTAVAGLLDLPAVHADPRPAPLAAALGQVLSDRDRVAADQARAVRERFSLDRWAEAWLRVVRAVAE
ncbi:MAG TPA: glycosyltransferase family 4 protein [Armatimonadota bacterium]|nr:glycosyltransferase family 4 protein [Armatimonadota bacterium]